MARLVSVPRRAPGQSGVTLIELMVAILLASILSGGLFFMMIQQDRVYNSQFNQVNSYQNLVGAMEYLQTEINRAGYPFTGCGGVLRVYDPGVSAPEPGVREELAFDTTNAVDSVGSDSFSIIYVDADATGFDDPTALQTVLPHNAQDPAQPTLISARGPGLVSANDLLVLWAPGTSRGCTLIQATTTPLPGSPTTFDHAAGVGYNPTLGHAIYPPNGYPAGSYVINLGTQLQNGVTTPALRRRTFSINRDRDPPRLVAAWSGQTNPDIIAEGIEDLQVAWACDVTGPMGLPDGGLAEGTSVATRSSDEWFPNVSATWPLGGAADVRPTCRFPAGCVFPVCQIAPIRAVRLTLVSRSVGAVIGDKTGFRPGAEDNAPGTTAQDLTATGGVGTYSRSVLTIVAQPRNIRRQ